jgi:nucleoside-diphosphate-sugar epimerase
VYASTSEIVSDSEVCPTPEETTVTINDIHNARWSYRIAKIASENYLANSTLPWVVVRYFNIYGADSKAGHFIADQITKIQSGEFVMSGGDETRSFCYISDGVAATIFVANNTVREVYNVGNDRETTILEAANTVARALGHDNIEWAVTPGMPGSTRRRLPDITKLRNLMTEYNPRTFAEGMKTVIELRGLDK